MAPVLLDQRRQLQILAAMLLALVIAYGAGYSTGVNKAENSQAQASDRVALTLPEPSVADSIDPVVPEVIAPGAEIDVDVPDDTTQASAVTQADPVPARPAPPKPATVKPAEPAAVASIKPAPESVAVVEPAVEAGLAIGGPAPDPQENEALASLAVIDDASAEDALYSIQVAIYGSFNNAQRHVDELSELNLSARLDEYLNKDNQTRYNVRFGYFASRASAVAALEAWQSTAQPKSGSGYVVRLSR
ncbi:MAG: SPOR domain-containing protein [Gammaproteobacteria bacterium]